MDISPFIERHGLWNDQQRQAGEGLLSALDGIEVVRVSWPDQHGILRGKSLTPRSFRSALRDGTEVTVAPFCLDTANDIVFNPFVAGGGFGMAELSGAPNLVMVPDPATFRRLPWATGTAWVLADLYLRDGRPFPFAPRALLRRALADLAAAGLEAMVGLEVEWYLTRLVDPRVGHAGLGGPGQPPEPPEVAAVAHGYSYLAESHIDEVDGVLAPLRRALVDIGLPLRSTDDEWGPGQFETTFEVLPAMEAADAMVLFRSATKQVCRRLGHHASFMCLPAVPSFCPSGWHLHLSLTDTGTGTNVFVPADGEPISAAGRHAVAGMLERAAAASVFTTPTVNGYRRRRPCSLAPDRAAWGIDNRGAMLRVVGGPADAATRIENRVGEPAANPYLYLASQVAAVHDGLARKLEPPPATDEPYALTGAPMLPASLAEAVDALRDDPFYRDGFGDGFVDYLVRIKEHEASRFAKSTAGDEALPAEVTDWEQREYFDRF